MVVREILWIILVGTPVIGVLILVHELGHFLVAKLCGVGVLKFSIGFGPALYRVRIGETVYQIGAIPLGGFVKMVGDIPDPLTGSEETDTANLSPAELAARQVQLEDSLVLEALLADRSKWFIEKGFWARFAIVFAGPLSNFLLPIVLVAIAAFFYGQEDFLPMPVIGSVSSGSPAEKSGLKPGDRVAAVSGEEISSWESLTKLIHHGTGAELPIVVERGGEKLTIVVTPQKKSIPDFASGGAKKEVFLIGIGPSSNKIDMSLKQSLHFGLIWTLDKTVLTYYGLWAMVRGKASPKDLAGPLFIFEAVGKEAKKGLMNVLYFMALLSVSLAVLNLLPIPVLDGGHLMFFVLESVLGPISERTKEMAQNVGAVLLFSLLAFAIHNDITQDRSTISDGVRWDRSHTAPAKP